MNFIQVDSDKLFYIDGGSSFDLLKDSTSVITYTWSLEGYPALKFPNSKILSLSPALRK